MGFWRALIDPKNIGKTNKGEFSELCGDPSSGLAQTPNTGKQNDPKIYNSTGKERFYETLMLPSVEHVFKYRKYSNFH